MAIDWGNVPSWVGSLLTGTSLGIAAITYFRTSQDRQRVQAAKVSLWEMNARKAMVHNANDVAVAVVVMLPGERDGQWSHRSERLRLGPAETRGVVLPAELEGKWADVALAVIDSHGRQWVRHGNGRLERLTLAGAQTDPATLRWEGR